MVRKILDSDGAHSQNLLYRTNSSHDPEAVAEREFSRQPKP